MIPSRVSAKAKKKKKRKLGPMHKPAASSVRNDINVTPLVDVCLVLLIIFMVVLPKMQRGKDTALPRTHHHLTPGDNGEPIFAILSDRSMYVGTKQVKDLNEAKDMVKDEWQTLVRKNSLAKSDKVDHSGEARVLVKADPSLSYGKIYPVLFAMHEIGASIDLGTNDAKKEN